MSSTARVQRQGVPGDEGVEAPQEAGEDAGGEEGSSARRNLAAFDINFIYGIPSLRLEVLDDSHKQNFNARV
jgi:hypothetical protein